MSEFEDNSLKDERDFKGEDSECEKSDFEKNSWKQQINSENEFYEGTNEDSDGDFQTEKSDFEKNSWRHRIYSESEFYEGGNSDSDGDYQREKSELELLRERNIKKNEAFLAMLMNDPEYAEVVASATELKKAKAHKVINLTSDPCFRYRGHVSRPLEQRRSFRLQNIPPVFFKEDLIDESEISRKRKRSQEYDYYDLETVIYRPRTSRMGTHNAIRADIIKIDEVTNEMITNIARKGTIKIYSDAGTSCHQCRQKTMDQKTSCRSGNCTGVRGQFCGVCLENRYGEDVAVALKDPHWKCPVCRGVCNCSFCRQKAGKRPTGILAPLAQQTGHKSVKDFLESLKGEGDYSHQDSMWQRMNDPSYLLGFSTDWKFAHMGRDAKREINYFLTLEELKKFIRKEENKLESVIDLHNEPRSLLGFLEGTDQALLDDGTYCYMGHIYLTQNFERLLQKKLEELSKSEKKDNTKFGGMSETKYFGKEIAEEKVD